MAESKPKRKRGGHAYGRRNQDISNTAVEGELCLYAGHGIGRFSDSSMRYDSHSACVRCVASAREGRISLDINRLNKKHHKRFLKFWSQVDIRGVDDCWNWHGLISRGDQPQFCWRRNGISSSTQHHPQRVAMWFTWGDLGYTGVKTTCGNKFCCNPLHLIPQKIGVFVDHDSYHDSFEIQCEIHTLKQQIQEYILAEAIAEEERKLKDSEEQARAELMFTTESEFAERLEAVMGDIMAGRNVADLSKEVIDKGSLGFLGIPDNGEVTEIEDPDNPTELE